MARRIETLTTRDARTQLALAAATLAASVVACLLLSYGWTDLDDGLSWFGTRRETALPYLLGFLGASLFLARAVRRLPKTRALQPTRGILCWTAVLLVGLAATPYTVNAALDGTHKAIGTALFVGQLLYAGGLAWARRRAVDVGLVCVMVVAGFICFVYLTIGLQKVMLAGQLVFQAAFIVVVWRELGRRGERPTEGPPCIQGVMRSQQPEEPERQR